MEEWFEVIAELEGEERMRFEYITEAGKTLVFNTIEERQMTLGEERVRIDFNPSGDQRVNDIKKAAAHLIDMIAALDQSGGDQHTIDERKRCVLFAQWYAEDAAMWAVKGATLK